MQAHCTKSINYTTLKCPPNRILHQRSLHFSGDNSEEYRVNAIGAKIGAFWCKLVQIGANQINRVKADPLITKLFISQFGISSAQNTPKQKKTPINRGFLLVTFVSNVTSLVGADEGT